jgi:energy-coupling factor transporter ATP-binding protein EcfA2
MVLERRCLDELLSGGLRAEHLGMPGVQQAFKYLVEHRAEYSSLPTLSEFVRQNPGVIPEPAPPDVSPAAVAAELIGLSLQRQVAVQLAALQSKTLTTPQAVQEAITQMRTLLYDHQPNTTVTAGGMSAEPLAWYERGKDATITGLPYPWPVLNTETRGIQPTDFIVLYGRPKSGKTFELLHVLNHISQQREGRVLFVSFEMSRNQLMNRLACIRAKVDYGRFNKGLLSPTEYQTLGDALADIRYSEKLGREIVFAGPAISPARRKKAYSLLDVEQAARDTGAIAVFIDGLLHAADVRTGKRSREWTVISNLSSDAKQLALSLNVPVIVTHQANREGEKDVPVDSQRDIANADALGQDADMTLRITKIRADRSGARQLLLQPTGAREFELPGFLVSGAFCEGMTDWCERVDDYKKLKSLLRKEVDEDPLDAARPPTNSLGGASRAGHAAKVKKD